MEKAYFKIVFLGLIASTNAFPLTITPSLPKLKDIVLIEGEGYKPFEEIEISLEKKTQKIKTSSGGTFSTTFIIQFQPGGQKIIKARGKTKLETISFWIKPTIKAFPLKGTRDTLVNISGEGYEAYEKIQIGLGRNSLVTWGTASSRGTFSTKFFVTNQPYGTQVLFAVGHKNYLDDRIDFFMEPYLTITPKKASVGSLVTISGTGFSPSDGPSFGEPIIVDFGTHQTLAIGYTNYYGSFEIPLKVPFCKGGLVDVRGRGGYSNVASSLNFKIIPRIKQFPQFGEPTRPVKIEADGFSSFETVTITLEKGMEGTKTLTQRETFFADENGAFSFNFLLDTQPKGIKRITIKGEFGFLERGSIEIKPFVEIVEIDRRYGTLTLKGGGFMEGEDVKLGLMEARYLGSVKADKEGFFLATFFTSGLQQKEEVVAYGTKSKEITKVYWEERK